MLLAVSDNGPQMRSHSTREFLAGVHIAQHFGRPHTPTDQAWIEALFGHVKGEWPHLEKITDPGDLDAELTRVRASTTLCGCTPRSATSPPKTNTRAAVRPSGYAVVTGSNKPAKHASTTVEVQQENNHDRTAVLVGY